MVESFFQQGLPEALKNKAIIIKQDPIKYAWKFEEIKSLFYWLTINDYIIDSIFVYKIKNKVPSYINERWIYFGDRTKNFEKNKECDRLQSFAFIENIHSKYASDLLYDVLFESVKGWDKIRVEFFNRAIIAAGSIAYTPDDSLDIIKRCRELEKKITGIDAFIIDSHYTQPQDYDDYSEYKHKLSDPSHPIRTAIVIKPDDVGHWEEARKFVKERASKGWVFVIGYEEPTLKF